ncbi:MAG: hypothetical protein L3J94_01175 [Gammaproteobacteria bacterium]|nr:hypothetical protein [Gammaproteobacteria bacterium]
MFRYLVVAALFPMLSGCGGDTPASSSEPERVEKIVARESNRSCLAPADAIDTATRLSTTGCFTDVSNQIMAGGVIPYTVNSVLWSDGESKGRYFAVPDGTTISLTVDESSIVASNGTKNGDFNFPVGAVVIKHFYSGSRIVETRLLMNHANDGWGGYAYQWDESQSDGTLLVGSNSITTPVSHYFPSREECMECHTDAARVLLGPDTLQLNYPLYYTDGTEENYLDALVRLNYLSAPLLADYKVDRLYAIDDSDAPLEQRARSYLHSNCSGCHRTGAPQGGFDLRYTSSFVNNVCGIAAAEPTSPTGGLLIDPGNADNATIQQRLASMGSIQMPPIGREQTDPEAVQVMADWINSLQGCD